MQVQILLAQRDSFDDTQEQELPVQLKPIAAYRAALDAYKTALDTLIKAITASDAAQLVSEIQGSLHTLLAVDAARRRLVRVIVDTEADVVEARQTLQDLLAGVAHASADEAVQHALTNTRKTLELAFTEKGAEGAMPPGSDAGDGV
jgi:hypothetical protein